MLTDRDFDENDYEALLALDDTVESRKGELHCVHCMGVRACLDSGNVAIAVVPARHCCRRQLTSWQALELAQQLPCIGMRALTRAFRDTAIAPI